MSALRYPLKSVTVDVWAGGTLDEAMTAARELAEQLQINVHLIFNDVETIVWWHD